MSKSEKIVFTEPLLRRMTKDPTNFGKEFTDGGCRCLVLYIQLDGTVSFTFRKRVKGAPRGRVFEKFTDCWSSAFTLDDARDAVRARISDIKKNGLRPPAESCTVGESIPKYEAARKRRDPLASRKRKPLGKKWPEHRERFKDVFKDLLATDVNRLVRQDFTDAMERYGKECEAEDKKRHFAKPEKDRKPAVNGVEPWVWDQRRLRPMMVYTMPMLNWYTRQYRLDPREVYGLVPPDYEADTRYLLPGEWQACAPHIDEFENDLGLFWRYVFLTCTRTSQAASMQWDDINWEHPRTWSDANGVEHKALIWVPPRETQKMRDQEGGEELPRKVLITGETFAILERLRAIWERNRKDHPDWNGVFTERQVQRFFSARTDLQRGMEEKAGVKPWDRMSLRHTHSTYLGFLGCPPGLISLSMNHSQGGSKNKAASGDYSEGAAITDRYNNSDASMRLRPNDPLTQLAPWHLRLHKLLRDIERGVKSADLAGMQQDMRDGPKCRDMCKQHGINRAFIDVKSPRLAAVA